MMNKCLFLLRKIAIVLADVIAVVLSAFFAFLIINPNAIETPTLLLIIGCNMVCAIALLAAFGLYNVVFSSVGITDFIKSLVVVGALGLGNIIFVAITDQSILSFAAVLVYALLLYCLVCFIRSAKRIWIAVVNYFQKRQEVARVMIVGGGAAGVALIKEILNDSQKKKVAIKTICFLVTILTICGSFLAVASSFEK